MLKIKDNVDLKELEKFGFEFVDTGPMAQFGCNHYILDTQDTYFVIYCNSRELNTDWNNEKHLSILYDLIQAGLVEKVED